MLVEPNIFQEPTRILFDERRYYLIQLDNKRVRVVALEEEFPLKRHGILHPLAHAKVTAASETSFFFAIACGCTIAQ